MTTYPDVRTMSMDALLSEQKERISIRCNAWNKINSRLHNRMLTKLGMNTVGTVPVDVRLVQINNEIDKRKKVRPVRRRPQVSSLTNA
jgi:hypothetical protein